MHGYVYGGIKPGDHRLKAKAPPVVVDAWMCIVESSPVIIDESIQSIPSTDLERAEDPVAGLEHHLHEEGEGQDDQHHDDPAVLLCFDRVSALRIKQSMRRINHNPGMFTG